MKTDLLDEFRNRLQAWLQALSPAARWTAVAVIIAAVVGLVFMLQSKSSGPDSYLFIAEIPDDDLSAMRSAFARAGLADYMVDGGRIKVPHDQQNLYFRTLEEANALPREFGDLVSEALRDSGPFETRDQKAERIKNARQLELARIVGMMKGIERATVLYDEQPGSGLRARPRVSASAAVKAKGNLELTSNQVVTIRNLVAGAVAGLEPIEVAVTCLNSGRTYVPSQDVYDDLKQPQGYADHKAVFEQQWKQKIEDSLHWVSGLEVTVDVTLHRAAPGTADQPAESEWTPDHVKVALAVPKTHVKEVWLSRSGIPAGRASQFRPDPQQLAALQAEIAAELRTHVAGLIPRSGAAASPLDIQLTFFDQIDRGPTAAPVVARAYKVPIQLKWPIMLLFGLVAVSVVGLLWSKRSTIAQSRNSEPKRNAKTMDDAQQPIDEIRISAAANSAHTETTVAADSPSHEPRRTSQRVIDFVKSEPKPKRLVPRGYVAGLELNDWTGFQLNSDDEPAAAAARPAATTPKRKKRLKLLEDIEASDLAQMLSAESAQVVAVVFSHLDSRQAADVLKELPPALRIEVVRRLSNLDQMTDEVVKEIEDGLQSRLADQIHRTRRRNAGIRAVSGILDAATSDLRNDILGQLHREDVALSRKLQGDSRPPERRSPNKQPLENQPTITPRRREPSKAAPTTPEPVITFEDVIHLDDDTLRTVLGAAEPQVAILALAGATNEVVDRLIQSMKPQEAERLRGALTNLGPTRLRDVEASQKNLVEVASSLDAEGRINLRAKRPLRLSA